MLKKLAKILAIALVILVPAVAWTQRWNIYDSWRLRNYTPTQQIAQLATDTTMNSDTRRLFYVYYPELDDKGTFNKNCTSSEQTIVLGCYVDGQGIYLYNVTDERLNGIQQVTAAHEVLHAAYARLSPRDKQHINALLLETFAKISDERIKSNIEDYRKKGADTTNELHSILGTEVRDLPAELENYYERYFTDRMKIVSYSEQYEKAFSERKEKVEAYDKQLEELKKNIEDGEALLNDRANGLDAEHQRLTTLLEAKNYAAYNAGVPGYNRMVNSYNAEVGYVRGLIDQYNDIVAKRNDLVSEESDLVKAIDSRPETVQTQ